MRGHRRGFTLIEIIVAMALTLAVFAITLPFVRAQTRALGTSAGRLDADQIARYAQRAIDRDLRLASGVDGQPLLVYAGRMAIVFNANLVAPDTTDPGAADVETGAATTLTEGFALADAAALPLDSRVYPEQAYLDGDGVASRSETIAYFLHPDTITGRSDIYVLYRRVNARDSVQIVRGLHVPADSSFFNYQRPLAGTLTRIAEARLPLYWDSAAVDSVTAVGIRAAGYFKDRLTGAETIRTVQWTTMIPNGGAAGDTSCGSAPAPPTAPTSPPTVASKTTAYGRSMVLVRWSRSTDDVSGGDVRAYVIGRRISGSGAAWEAVGSLPAIGLTAYQFYHAVPRSPSASYEYSVRAVDCGQNTSTALTSGVLVLP